MKFVTELGKNTGEENRFFFLTSKKSLSTPKDPIDNSHKRKDPTPNNNLQSVTC